MGPVQGAGSSRCVYLCNVASETRGSTTVCVCDLVSESFYFPTAQARNFNSHLTQLLRACPAGTPAPTGASASTGTQAAAAAGAAPRPRVVSLQNAYSLTCRTFDSGGLAEVCHLEGVGLLAYSPLAMGLLTVRR